MISTTGDETGLDTSKIVAVENFLYPNPAANTLYISQVTSPQARVYIYDLQGNLVIGKKIAGNAIDISDLANGIYWVRMIDNEKVFVCKFIKLRN